MAAVSLQAVRKTYGVRAALDDVTFEVEPGEFVALIGGSGSGKTTALKAINGLATLDAGEVRVFGENVAKADGPRLRRSIGYVIQEVGLFPHMTVAGNIAVGPELAGWAKPEIAARTSELLKLVQLPLDLGVRMPSELSGGQRQRVGLARALAARARLMLMDEPFGALDPITRDRLGSDYLALHRELGLTTVLVTHDVAEALLLADRVLVLSEGRLVADSTPSELLAGHADPVVAALTDTPRRQAAALSALGAGL